MRSKKSLWMTRIVDPRKTGLKTLAYWVTVLNTEKRRARNAGPNGETPWREGPVHVYYGLLIDLINRLKTEMAKRGHPYGSQVERKWEPYNPKLKRSLRKEKRNR